VRGIGPFNLHVRGIGCTEEYFKTLFVEFEEDDALRHLSDRIRGGLQEDSGYRLFPHLSLLYNDMPLRDKQALARRVRLDRNRFVFGEVKITTALNAREGWRDTARWQTVFRMGLGAPAPEEVQ
jgi:putative hydrolase of the HAD superfamily